MTTSRRDKSNEQQAQADAKQAEERAARLEKSGESSTTTGTGGGLAAGASARSQTQSASEEPEQQAKTPEQQAEETGEPVHFDTTVTKVDADGNTVMSDYLAPGEKLKRTTTAEREAERLEQRRQANEEQNK